MRPRFEYGDEVRVIRNVRNDGTYPGKDTGNLLVRRGSTGYVRDVGTFLQDQIIYSVHFLHDDRVVGCREEELQAADEPWTPSRFEFRDKVAARLTLTAGGRVLVEQGEVGEIVKVLRGAATRQGVGDVAYHVHFSGRNTLQVPESALEPVLDQTPAGAEGSAQASPPADSANTSLAGQTAPDRDVAPPTASQEDTP
jgi:nitrogen fixation protein NifZ